MLLQFTEGWDKGERRSVRLHRLHGPASRGRPALAAAHRSGLPTSLRRSAPVAVTPSAPAGGDDDGGQRGGGDGAQGEAAGAAAAAGRPLRAAAGRGGARGPVGPHAAGDRHSNGPEDGRQLAAAALAARRWQCHQPHGPTCFAVLPLQCCVLSLARDTPHLAPVLRSTRPEVPVLALSPPPPGVSACPPPSWQRLCVHPTSLHWHTCNDKGHQPAMSASESPTCSTAALAVAASTAGADEAAGGIAPVPAARAACWDPFRADPLLLTLCRGAGGGTAAPRLCRRRAGSSRLPAPAPARATTSTLSAPACSPAARWRPAPAVLRRGRGGASGGGRRRRHPAATTTSAQFRTLRARLLRPRGC